MPPQKPARPQGAQRPVVRQPAHQPEVVDPSWILKAVGAIVAAGLLCAYVTLCTFFYLGQWQFVLHPSRTVTAKPSSQNLAFEPVRFGDDVSGEPQLTGWWIPSDLSSDPTVLFLHGEKGNMGDALPLARALHDARLNVLLFDYRGYGASGGRHPSESLMRHDAEGAYTFLTSTRHIPPAQILVFGQDLGASLATMLCQHNPQVAGLILFDADGDTASRVEADQRSKVIPVDMLFHERFPLADPLHSLSIPKLLISTTRGNAPVYAQRAADPKLTVEIGPGAGPGQVTTTVRRFLDAYAKSSVPPAPLVK